MLTTAKQRTWFLQFKSNFKTVKRNVHWFCLENSVNSICFLKKAILFTCNNILHKIILFKLVISEKRLWNLYQTIYIMDNAVTEVITLPVCILFAFIHFAGNRCKKHLLSVVLENINTVFIPAGIYVRRLNCLSNIVFTALCILSLDQNIDWGSRTLRSVLSMLLSQQRYKVLFQQTNFT